MASITTQLADEVTTLINAGAPYVGELRAERLPVVHFDRQNLEHIQVFVRATPRDSAPQLTRGKKWQRDYEIEVTFVSAVDTFENLKADCLHEVFEQVTEQLEQNNTITIGTRCLSLIALSSAEDDSLLTDSQALTLQATVTYREVY